MCCASRVPFLQYITLLDFAFLFEKKALLVGMGVI
jgi:hypothetical protein